MFVPIFNSLFSILNFLLFDTRGLKFIIRTFVFESNLGGSNRLRAMIISFNEHSDAPINFAHVFQPNEIDLDDEDARITGEIQVAGAARRSSGIAFVNGTIRGALEILCSRCAAPISKNLETEFAVEFVTAENYPSGAETEVSGQDLTLSVYGGDHIDLDEIVREQILLDLPARQLCGESCQGFCATCGKNKNKDVCQCETKEIDPRWTALNQLRIKK